MRGVPPHRCALIYRRRSTPLCSDLVAVRDGRARTQVAHRVRTRVAPESHSPNPSRRGFNFYRVRAPGPGAPGGKGTELHLE